MVIYVDIDETICQTPESRDYSLATPIKDRIEKINKLYDDGHNIVYWTARGSTNGNDYTELTIMQLKKWGAKFNKVELKKPYYDLFIDDRAINSDVFFDIAGDLVEQVVSVSPSG